MRRELVGAGVFLALLSTPCVGAPKPKTTIVECAKGQTIQAAIDTASGPTEIQIRGVCVENVRIARGEVALLGLDPANDGIRGPAAGVPTVEIVYTDRVRLERLAISDGAGAGVKISFASATMTDCEASSNAEEGVVVKSGELDATGLAASSNHTNGLFAERGASIDCTSCELEDNGSFAAIAANASKVDLTNSVLEGDLGLAASEGSRAHLICLMAPCSLDATFDAISASDDSSVVVRDVDFTGNIVLRNKGFAWLFGGRQISASGNAVVEFSSLFVQPLNQTLPGHQGQLKRTVLRGFSELVMVPHSTLDGDVTCTGGADAWVDPAVTLTPGSTIGGCEHAP